MKYIKTFESVKALPSIEKLDDFFLEYIESGNCTIRTYYKDSKYIITYYVSNNVNITDEIRKRLDVNGINYEYTYNDMGKKVFQIEYDGNNIIDFLNKKLKDIYRYHYKTNHEGLYQDKNIEGFYKNYEGEIVLCYNHSTNKILVGMSVYDYMISNFRLEISSLLDIITMFVNKYTLKYSSDEFPENCQTMKCTNYFVNF